MELYGFYQCPTCGKYYTLSRDCDDYLSISIKSKGVQEAITICDCGNAHLVGCEYEEDPDFGPCGMMFGSTPTESQKRVLMNFKSQMLDECSKEESETSTFCRRRKKVIYLKRRC